MILDKIDRVTKILIAVGGLFVALATGMFTAFEIFHEIKDNSLKLEEVKKEFQLKIDVLEHRSDSRMKRGEAYRNELNADIKELENELEALRIKLGQ